MSVTHCVLVCLLSIVHVDTLLQLKCHYEYHESTGASSKLYDLINPGLGPGYCLTNPELGQKCSKWTSLTTGQELESCYSCEELRDVLMPGDTCVDCMRFDLCIRHSTDNRSWRNSSRELRNWPYMGITWPLHTLFGHHVTGGTERSRDVSDMDCVDWTEHAILNNEL